MDRPRYNSIHNVPSGYTPEEWEFVVTAIDPLPKETLAAICLDHGIDFGESNRDVDEENMVWALTGGHLTPAETLEIAREFGSRN